MHGTSAVIGTSSVCLYPRIQHSAHQYQGNLGPGDLHVVGSCRSREESQYISVDGRVQDDSESEQTDTPHKDTTLAHVPDLWIDLASRKKSDTLEKGPTGKTILRL